MTWQIFEQILNKFGWPILILGIIAAITRYTIWPRVAQYLDDARTAQLEAHQTLKDRATKLEAREDDLLSEFKGSIDNLTESLAHNAQRNDKQIELIEEVLTEVRESRETSRTRKRES